METFAFRFTTDLPASDNPNILNLSLAKIDPRDLNRVIAHWGKLNSMLDKMQTPDDEVAIKKYLRDSIRTVCQHTVEKNAFAKYQLRPHITVHSGARAGNKYSEKIARDLALKTGREVRRHGFSFWYGGGTQGLMGDTGKGFSEDDQRSYPDQYSVQVSPAQFVQGVKQDGMKAVNEGLASNTDAAIVTPNFITRRHILDTALTKSDAAITLVGAEGSLDEWSDIATHVKTGLMPDRTLVALNPRLPLVLQANTPFGALSVRVPGLHTHFWNPLEKQRNNFVTYGYGTEQARAAFPFFENLDNAFSHIMRKLDKAGLNPHHVYAENLKRFEVQRAARPAEMPKIVRRTKPLEAG